MSTKLLIYISQMITSSAIPPFHLYLQTNQQQWVASTNRSLSQLKKLFEWIMQMQFISYDPWVLVKLIG